MEMVGWLTRSSNVNSAACLIFIGIAYPRRPSCRYGVFAPPGGQYQRLAVGAGKHRSVSIKYSVSCDKWPVFALLPPPFPSARQAAHSRQSRFPAPQTRGTFLPFALGKNRKPSGSAGGLVKFDSSESRRLVDGERTLARCNSLSSRRGGEGRGEEARSKNHLMTPSLPSFAELLRRTGRRSPRFPPCGTGRERRGLKPWIRMKRFGRKPGSTFIKVW